MTPPLLLSPSGRSPLAADHASEQETLATEQALLLLRALADPIRLRILQALTQGERCVCELCSALELAQSKLSFHLRVLREAGLIEGRSQGRWMYYQLRPDALERLQAWLGSLAALASSGQGPATTCS